MSLKELHKLKITLRFLLLSHSISYHFRNNFDQTFQLQFSAFVISESARYTSIDYYCKKTRTVSSKNYTLCWRWNPKGQRNKTVTEKVRYHRACKRNWNIPERDRTRSPKHFFWGKHLILNHLRNNFSFTIAVEFNVFLHLKVTCKHILSIYLKG